MTTVKYPYLFDTETIFKIFTKKNFIEEKYKAVGAKNIEFIEYGEKEGKFIIHTQRDILIEVPNFAKKFIQPTPTIIQTEIWNITDEDVKKGTAHVKVKGLSLAEMSGEIILQPTDNGSENVFTYGITVHIPFIGTKLSNFLDAEGKKAAQKEYEFAVQYVSNME